MNRDPDPEKTEVVDMSDADVERLLQDAYSAPPVPASLLKRIDRVVSEQWGASPQVGLKDPNWLADASNRAVRSWKTWPMVAGLAAMLILVMSLRTDAHAYSWAAVVEALSRQTVVRLGTSGTAQSGSSWLSILKKKIGARSGNVDRLYDFAQGFVLERRVNDSQATRYKLVDVSGSSDHTRIALAFLIGDSEMGSLESRLPDLQVRNEDWKHVGDAVELMVTLGSDRNQDEVQLTLVLDPKTKLPRTGLVTNSKGKVRDIVLSYPPSNAEQLIAQVFPSDLPIVEGSGSIASTKTVAANSTASSTSADVPVTVPNGVNKQQALSATGAASLGWTQVGASQLSNDDAVNAVDALLQQLWESKNIEPVGAASDTELLRRVYLDLAGRTPTVAEVRSYVIDSSPDRYPKLVDRLVASPDYATHLASVWRTFLLPEGVDLSRFGGVPAFDEWLSGRFGRNVPYDQLVRELLLAEGRLSRSGPLLFYSAAKLDADVLAGRTARVFLGMRLECAQCHDDPFEPWTQQDFWSYAAFFARISRPQAALESVSTVMQVRDVQRGEVMMPDSKEPVPPRFLDGSNLDESKDGTRRRQQLARWLTGPDNPYFARAAVNRVWAHLFGRGIVDPVDGFGKRNPPRSQELLDLLAAQFIANNFDLRQMFRMIALTRAYKLSSGSEATDPARLDWFAQMNVKMLTAEQVYDCITVASMLVATESSGFSIARTGNAKRDDFLQQFKTLAGRPTEYQGGIPQALTLMNGSLIYSATTLAESGLLKSLEAPFFTDDQRIEVLYLATLSRQPTEQEWLILRKYLQDRSPDSSVQEPLADILWALLNGAEFVMNH